MVNEEVDHGGDEHMDGLYRRLGKSIRSHDLMVSIRDNNPYLPACKKKKTTGGDGGCVEVKVLRGLWLGRFWRRG